MSYLCLRYDGGGNSRRTWSKAASGAVDMADKSVIKTSPAGVSADLKAEFEERKMR